MVNKEDYYSATVNATVLDHKGNPQQMVTKNDGRYGQNSPKTEAKGVVIAPAAVNGGECVCVYKLYIDILNKCAKKLLLYSSSLIRVNSNSYNTTPLRERAS